MAARDEFVERLRQVKRPGIEALIQYLAERTDFFTSPASTLHHGAYEGGLLDHSLAVYDNLLKVCATWNLTVQADTLIICALLHDLCKANFYRKGFRNRKNEQTGQWEKVEVYEIDDQFPVGHGEKSVILLQRYIVLTDEELMAIRWHMGGFDDSARAYGGAQALSGAMKQYPLAVAMQVADLATTYFDQK